MPHPRNKAPCLKWPLVTTVIGMVLAALEIPRRFENATVNTSKRHKVTPVWQPQAFLEHAAFYSIFVLSVIMFLNSLLHAPETLTGLTGVGLIGVALFTSTQHNKRQI